MRSDDGGMSHSVDLALERLIATGVPLSVSVMFPTPWHQETVDSLRRRPDAAVGVRLTLPDTTRNRHGHPTALTSARFGDDLHAHDVKSITYRQLIEGQGQQSMRRPGEETATHARD